MAVDRPVAHGARGLVAVDIAGFSAVERTGPVHVRLRRELYTMLEATLEAADIDFKSCYHEDRGDGAIVVLPPGVSMVPVADRFVERLRYELRHHNGVANDLGRLRVRVGLHVGEVYDDGRGLVGRPVIDLFRLLDAEVFKQALADSAGDLAVIVSDRLYEDVVREGWEGIDPAEYRSVRVHIKEVDVRAWIRIPGRPAAPEVPGPEAPRPEAPGSETRRPPAAKPFSTRITRPRSPMSLAFGADDTLVAAGHDGSVHRWSLADGTELPGLSAKTHTIGRQLAASTVDPIIAMGAPKSLLLATFSRHEVETTTIPLADNEFLVPTSGRRVATYTGRRVVVRSFAHPDESWACPCPNSLATVAVSQDGDTVAMANSRELTIARRDGTGPAPIRFNNVTMAGCSLAFSPDGDLLACASFAETIVVRTVTGQVLHRRTLSWSELIQAAGATRMRTQCTREGDVLRLSRGRLWVTKTSTAEFAFPIDSVKYDDVVLDPAGRRVATVDGAGMLRVRELYNHDTT